MNGWDARSGIRYAGWTVLKLAILYAAIMTLCILELGTFCRIAGIGTDPVSVISESSRYVMPFIPLPFIALLAGGFGPGDGRRLASRMIMSAYLVATILLITGDMSYSLQGIAVPHESGAVVDSASLEMTAEGFAAILVLVPILSAIDAFLEWRSGCDRDADDSGNPLRSPAARIRREAESRTDDHRFIDFSAERMPR